MPASVYPPQSLKEALRIPKAIAEKSSGRPMPRLRLAEQLAERPESGKFRALLTASRAYGLTEGSREAKNIELTQLGVRVAAGDLQAVFEALLSVELFSRFYTEYEGRVVPAEGVLKDYLRDDCGVPQKQVDHVHTGILEDARDWGLIQESAGAERVVPREMATEKAMTELGHVGPTFYVPEQPQVMASTTAAETRKRVKIEPGLQLTIAIHIAADTPEGTVETIFKNMKKYLLPNE